MLQRDTGVALLTLLVASTYLAFVRIPWRAWAGVALLGVAAFAALWMFVLAPYQQSRILDVVDPGRDPLASGYQAIQSRIAVGSGGLLGKGWLEGTQIAAALPSDAAHGLRLLGAGRGVGLRRQRRGARRSTP